MMRIYFYEKISIKLLAVIFAFVTAIAASFIDRSSLAKDNILIPKIIHRIWFSFDKNNPHIPQKYIKEDFILMDLHKDWTIMRWDEEKVESFIKRYYPNFYKTYMSYDAIIKKHDAARYLILKEYGGIFIQHSIKIRKNLEPLLRGSKIVFSKQSSDTRYLDLLANGFIASTPKHPFWDLLISNLPATKNNYVLDATGPNFLTNMLKTYMRSASDTSVKVLRHKYLFPFDWNEKNLNLINELCIKEDTRCFKLFPDAYGYCLWTAVWLEKPA